MNTGQMLLAVGAVMLIGLIVLRNSNVSLYTTEAVTQSKIRILMTDCAQSIIEEASTKRFGEASVNNPIRLLTDLDAPGSLRCEENVNDESTFDDYDDYNRSSTGGYIYNTIYSGIPVRVKVRVYYVNLSNPNLTPSASRSWNKKMDVTVRVTPGSYNFMSNDSVAISRVFSFFQFGIR